MDSYEARAAQRHRIEETIRIVDSFPSRVAAALPPTVSDADRAAVIECARREADDIRRMCEQALSRLPADA